MSKLQTKKAAKPTRKEKAEIKDRMRGFITFLPNMFKLLGRLLTDSRVPTTEKILVAGAILYVIMPFDFIPDMIPFIGQVDDTYLVALTLLRLINRTDESVIREHWSGGGDVVSMANSIAGIAPMLLPKRVARVLSAEVELTPAGKSLNSIGKKDRPLIVEIPAIEHKSKT
ncbi:MAG: YkvA family protein [Acidobacteriota bacterium]|nr:YkvA family protein [Acidobacteriota bacterium]